MSAAKQRRLDRLQAVEAAIGELQDALVMAVAEEESQGSEALAERLEGWKIVLDAPRADVHRIVNSLAGELERSR